MRMPFGKQLGTVDDDEVGGSPKLTGGDIDAAWEQAATVGDEAGGTVSTPDQDVLMKLELLWG